MTEYPFTEIKYTFMDNKEYPLIDNPKLIRALNRRCNKVYKKLGVDDLNDGLPYNPVMDMSSIYGGVRSELREYSDGEYAIPGTKWWLPRWIPDDNVVDDVKGCFIFDMVIHPAGFIGYKGEKYFFCFRFDEYREAFRLWFKVKDGVEISDD